jgi:hypothetical protein
MALVTAPEGKGGTAVNAYGPIPLRARYFLGPETP